MADWPQPRKSIVLSVGAIPELVNLRAEVLRSAGYEVISTTSAQKADLHIANGDCDALLLCHSISDEWQARLIRQFRIHCPNGVSLRLAMSHTRGRQRTPTNSFTESKD